MKREKAKQQAAEEADEPGGIPIPGAEPQSQEEHFSLRRRGTDRDVFGGG